LLNKCCIGGYNIRTEEEGTYPVIRAIERMSCQKLCNQKFGCVFSLGIYENGLSQVIYKSSSLVRKEAFSPKKHGRPSV
jgi:hypothetical protein